MELLVQRCSVNGFRLSSTAIDSAVLDDEIPGLGPKSDLLGLIDFGKYRDSQNIW